MVYRLDKNASGKKKGLILWSNENPQGLKKFENKE